MIRTVWAMARNDLAVWRRSPAAIAASLLPALGMGLLVAVLTNSVGQQPVALVRKANGPHASRMAQIILDDDDAYMLREMNETEALQAIGLQRVAAIIVVPENFDDSVTRSEAIVDLYLNNIDIDLSDDIRRSVTRSVAEFDAPQLGLVGELTGPSRGTLLPNPYRVAIAEHDLRETNVSFLQYQVIPIIVLIVISIGLLGTSMLTARDFQRRTWKVLLLSPASRRSLVLGRLLGGTLLTAALVVPLMAVGFADYYIPYCSEEADVPLWVTIALSGPCAWSLPPTVWSHAMALFALLMTVTWMTVGLGILLGVALRDERLVTMTGLNVAAYLFFLGGGFTTVAFLPSWLQIASRFVPTSYAIEGLRQTLFYPELAGVGLDLLVLAAWAVGALSVAVVLLERTWKRAG